MAELSLQMKVLGCYFGTILVVILNCYLSFVNLFYAYSLNLSLIGIHGWVIANNPIMGSHIVRHFEKTFYEA